MNGYTVNANDQSRKRYVELDAAYISVLVCSSREGSLVNGPQCRSEVRSKNKADRQWNSKHGRAEHAYWLEDTIPRMLAEFAVTCYAD